MYIVNLREFVFIIFIRNEEYFVTLNLYGYWKVKKNQNSWYSSLLFKIFNKTFNLTINEGFNWNTDAWIVNLALWIITK